MLGARRVQDGPVTSFGERSAVIPIVAFAIGAGLVAAAAVATPTAPPASAGAANYLAAACTNCHATTKVAGDVLPLLAGQPKETLIDKLERFRDGRAAATVMQQLANGFSPEQIEAIAEYFAQQAQ